MYRIKEVLLEKGLKSKDLADMLGKSKQQISNIVNGNGSISMTMLNEVAEALNVPVWQLLVSPKEVVGEGSNTITCPRCGLKLEVKPETEQL